MPDGEAADSAASALVTDYSELFRQSSQELGLTVQTTVLLFATASDRNVKRWFSGKQRVPFHVWEVFYYALLEKRTPLAAALAEQILSAFPELFQ